MSLFKGFNPTTLKPLALAIGIAMLTTSCYQPDIDKIELNYFSESLEHGGSIIGRHQANESQSDETKSRYFELGDHKFFYSGEWERVEVSRADVEPIATMALYSASTTDDASEHTSIIEPLTVPDFPDVSVPDLPPPVIITPDTPDIEYIEHYDDGSTHLSDTGSKTFFAQAEGFSSSEEEAVISLEGTTLHYTMTDEESGKTARYSKHYTAFDLSGHTAAQSRQADIDGKGVVTFFNRLDDLPDELAFPEGSICFVPTYKVTDTSLYLYKTGGYGFFEKDLDEWEREAIEPDVDYDYFVTDMVGTNNAYEVRRLVYKNEDGTERYVSGIELKTGKWDTIEYETYYEANKRYYYDKNINPFNAVVDCKYINDTAAEFLEAEIPKYY